MENPCCFICLDDCDEIIQSECKCKSLFFHGECLKTLQKSNEHQLCHICNEKYKKIIIAPELQKAILEIIDNNYGSIELDVLNKCDILLCDVNACRIIMEEYDEIYKFMANDIKLMPEFIDLGIEGNQFKYFPEELKNDINICKKALLFDVFAAKYMPQNIYDDPEIQALIDKECEKTARDLPWITFISHDDDDEITKEIRKKVEYYKQSIKNNQKQPGFFANKVPIILAVYYMMLFIINAIHYMTVNCAMYYIMPGVISYTISSIFSIWLCTMIAVYSLIVIRYDVGKLTMYMERVRIETLY